MCLGIPGQIVEISDPENQLGKVDVGGVRRMVNLACIIEDEYPLATHPNSYLGAWVIVHVGFAMSRIDEDEAAATLKLLDEIGELENEMNAIRDSAR